MPEPGLATRLPAAIAGAAPVVGAGLLAMAALAWTGSAAVGASVAFCAGVVAAAFLDRRARGGARAAATLERAAQDAREGRGLGHVDPEELGPLSGVGRQFNAVVETLGAITHNVLETTDRVSDLPGRITASLEGIQESSEAQEEAVEETASLLANMSTSIRDINERVDRLSRSAEESASSVLEMGSSVDEVARNAATLHETVEASTSAVHEMGASIRQVADGADNVQRMAEETAASMTEMDRTVQQVSEHAKEAATLTDRVREGADQGADAVRDTIQDIHGIRDRTGEATAVLEQLAARIAEIDEILSVIGEINDETNLLSLNAAIIAAQAGEQGKAFLVVANHVKTLARRTASSTEEIERLIKAVQDESHNAVLAMGKGTEAIEQGVARSERAGQALDTIRESSSEASTRVAEIARAMDEQSRGSRHVASASRETSTQVQQISIAITEQSRASEQMLKSSEDALEMCRHVHRSTDEQRATGQYITSAISSITEMIRGIQQSTGSHATASDSTSEAVMRLLGNAQKSADQIPEALTMVRTLQENAGLIVEELSKLDGGATATPPSEGEAEATEPLAADPEAF